MDNFFPLFFVTKADGYVSGGIFSCNGHKCLSRHCCPQSRAKMQRAPVTTPRPPHPAISFLALDQEAICYV